MNYLIKENYSDAMLIEVIDKNLSKLETEEIANNIVRNLCVVNDNAINDGNYLRAAVHNRIFIDIEVSKTIDTDKAVEQFIAALDQIIDMQDQVKDCMFMSGKYRMPDNYAGYIDDIRVDGNTAEFIFAKNLPNMSTYIIPFLEASGFAGDVKVEGNSVTIEYSMEVYHIAALADSLLDLVIAHETMIDVSMDAAGFKAAS